MIYVHGDIKERKDNMSFKDYTLFSHKEDENKETEGLVIEPNNKEKIDNPYVEEDLHTGETEMDETINLEEIPEVASGVVKSNKLNVRKEPSKDAEILTTLVKDTPVGINLTKSTEDFYCVGLAIDDVLTQAYVMKDFIEVE